MQNLDNDQIAWDCGLSVGSPELPGGVCADLVFDIDRGGYPDLRTFNVSLYDADGEVIMFDCRLLSTIRFAIVEHMAKPGPSYTHSQMRRLEDACAERASQREPDDTYHDTYSPAAILALTDSGSSYAAQIAAE